MVHRPLRVLHCLFNVGGHPGSLARAEREMGLLSHAVELYPNGYGFTIDETLAKPSESAFQVEWKRWHLLGRAIRRFDIIHFNFGQSILMCNPYPERLPMRWCSIRPRLWYYYWRGTWMRDLPLLKAAGKGIVMTYQGDDARQGDKCRERYSLTAANFVEPGYYSPTSDYWKQRAIEEFAQYADLIYALNPDLLQVLPSRARFLPYAHISLKDWEPCAPTNNPVPLVAHAPTRRGVKGTDFVLAAVQRLREEGVPFEFVLIENVTQAEAKRIYEKADILVDQLLIGWYGGLAVEFMALGKPVVCYMRDEDLRFIPSAMRRELPIIHATPDTIFGVLKDLVTGRKGDLPLLGMRGRAFAENWHDPQRIARIVAEDYSAVVRK